jgi:DNA-binding GntR family transcriptional regulator
MTDAVADRLRSLILWRELLPGQRIRQAELATLLGVSTMPVREALLRLMTEGMVVADANRSFSVANTTADGIRDIYWLHGALAGELTARGWDNRGLALIETLRTRHEEYVIWSRLGDRAAPSRANWQFHAAINRAARAPALARSLRMTLHYFPDANSEVPGWGQVADRWQRAVLEAFEGGTREQARHAARSHIATAGELFVEHFWANSA